MGVYSSFRKPIKRHLPYGITQFYLPRCHRKQMIASRFNPRQAGRLTLDLFTPEKFEHKWT